jgi:hypothetical protein
MAEKSSITGFFKNMLGFQGTKAEAMKNNTVLNPAASSTSGFAADPGTDTDVKQPSVSVESGNPTPQTKAYQNRKKGRKLHRDSIGDLQRIIACIERRGQAMPGEIVQELGMSRSTLTYNLKRLSAYIPGAELTGRSHWTNRPLQYVLGQRRIERTGAGPSLRYRILEVPQAGSPVQPNPEVDGAGQGQEGHQ